MSSKKLSKDQERVLLFLYERKDNGEQTAEQIAAGTGLEEAVVARCLRDLAELGLIGGGESDDLLTRSMRCMSEMDANFKATDPKYPAYIVLIASALERADEPFLASSLGYDPEFVALVGSRLRTSGIWNGCELAKSHFDRWGQDSISFFTDGLVATGDLIIVGGPPDNRQYQMTDSGKRGAAELMRRVGR